MPPETAVSVLPPAAERQPEGYRAGLREALRICDRVALSFGDLPRAGLAIVRKRIEAALEN